MTTKTWADFYNWVLPECSGCPTNVADNAIREAAIEFCDASKLWEIKITVDIVANVYSYDLTSKLTDQQNSVAMRRVRIDNGTGNNPLEITAKSRDDLERLYGSCWDSLVGVVRHWNQIDENTLRLFRIPDTSYTAGLLVDIAVMPSPTASGVDYVVWQNWRQEIASGAKASLMMQSKKTYSNPNLAAKYRSDFDAALNLAGVRKGTDFIRQPLRSTTIHR